MNVVELIEDITKRYIEKSGQTMDVHTDYTEDDVENAGIFPIGDKKVDEDILGNVTRQASIVMFHVLSGSEDCERIKSETFLINMAHEYDSIQEDEYNVDIGNGDNIKHGKLKNIACSNAMLYGRTSSTGYPVYQMNLLVTYKLYD